MKLVKQKNGRFMAITNGVQIDGSWDTVVTALVGSYGFDAEELNSARDVLHQNNHDTASFGVNGILITTRDAYDVSSVLAELNAIRDTREEFYSAHKNNPESQETKLTYDRLMSLYFALNVKAAINLIERPENIAA